MILVPLWPGAYPSMLPGLLLAALFALVASAPLARRWNTSRAVAWLLVAGVGWALALTIAPYRWALDGGIPGAISCDLSRVGPTTLEDYLRLRDPLLNVLLFVPVGVAIGHLPTPHRRRLAITAALVPPAIEVTQAVVVPLGRACEGGDVFDNLAGLVIGLAAGATMRAAATRR